MKFGISPSSKLLTYLISHLKKCVNLVLLTKFSNVFLDSITALHIFTPMLTQILS